MVYTRVHSWSVLSIYTGFLDNIQLLANFNLPRSLKQHNIPPILKKNVYEEYKYIDKKNVSVDTKEVCSIMNNHKQCKVDQNMNSKDSL